MSFAYEDSGNGSTVRGEREGLVPELELTDEQVALLSNPNRRAIVHQLLLTPGLNKNQLSGELEILPNLLGFHIERLEEQGIVFTTEGARGKEILCFLEKDRHLLDDEDALIMFGRASTREIGTYIASNPGVSTARLAEEVDLAEVTVRHHLRTLREHNLVGRVREGRSFEYYPSEQLRGWMERVGEAFQRHHGRSEERKEDRGPRRRASGVEG